MNISKTKSTTETVFDGIGYPVSRLMVFNVFEHFQFPATATFTSWTKTT